MEPQELPTPARPATPARRHYLFQSKKVVARCGALEGGATCRFWQNEIPDVIVVRQFHFDILNCHDKHGRYLSSGSKRGYAKVYILCSKWSNSSAERNRTGAEWRGGK
ncbi:MAG TPA: hypothetical protein PKE29_12055, partial [Phycisphaerales bacterium]|nr:hypothetical protein [Phycisphaerales bacterium]